MGIVSDTLILVEIAEGAILGNDALREQVLRELAEAEE